VFLGKIRIIGINLVTHLKIHDEDRQWVPPKSQFRSYKLFRQSVSDLTKILGVFPLR